MFRGLFEPIFIGEFRRNFFVWQLPSQSRYLLAGWFLPLVFGNPKMRELASLFKEANRGDILYSMKLPKTYTPSEYEADIYALWEAKDAFAPKNRGNDDYYSIVMPPPNANANLHIGFELVGALEDIAVRYNRMMGKKTLFLPGADHAGFETQSVYEKHLAKEGKSRFDFSREELYSQIYDFVAQNRKNFESQMRAMGLSVDWDHYTYTLDQKIVDRAYQTFKRMWDDGLIYRGERLVNFCTFHGTGFADIEVEHKEVQGNIWSLRYPLTDGSGEITVATTRPETMLGDVAVAIHPEDERYQHLLGRTVKLPLTNREIPIIADDFVEREFGTGAVKITPAHDQNDYEAGKRHDLPMITVIGSDGAMTHEVPEAYRGLSVKEAREKVVADLEAAGNLVEVKEHINSVGHCYKCGTVIEPLLREQWFVDMKPLATRAIEILEANKIKFYPDSKKTQLVTYLQGLRDWNISRQQAWGIPIPAFQNIEQPDDWIFDTRVDQEIIEVGEKKYRRDSDVFDTWFSSSSWPYATLDFPDSQDYKDFYPISLMETGGEILYPWVSRMIMLGLYVTDEIPFKEVYIHGYVMAEDGSKMSKSIGNVVDPIPVINEFGSDALRMGIIAGRSPAVNRGYDQRRVEEARNFCNKLWNIARYIEGMLGDEVKHGQKPEPKTAADHWVIMQLNEQGGKIGEYIASYRFSEAYETLYHLVWDDVADWYIEASKTAQRGPDETSHSDSSDRSDDQAGLSEGSVANATVTTENQAERASAGLERAKGSSGPRPNASVMNYVLETILKLAHPFAPFVTETIWQTLHADDETLLAVASWPAGAHTDVAKADDFLQIQKIVSEVRQISTILRLNDTPLVLHDTKFAEQYCDLIAKMTRIKEVRGGEELDGLVLSESTVNARLLIDDKATHELTISLAEKEVKLAESIGQLQGRLSNDSYIQKAPEKLVNETREQLDKLQAELTLIKDQLQRFRT